VWINFVDADVGDLDLQNEAIVAEDYMAADIERF
jgi:hypothetical protein